MTCTGYIKAANSEVKKISKEARDVPVRLGAWSGMMDFTVVPLDDHKFIMGIEFMRKVEVVLMPHLNSISIMDKECPCMVPFGVRNQYASVDTTCGEL